MIKKLVGKITGNAYGFSVFAKIISVVTGLLYAILYSRYLGAELRGTASVINNYVEMIMLVLCFGTHHAYPYFKKKTGKDIYREFINSLFGMVIAYYILAAIFLAVVRPGTDVCVIAILIPSSLAIRELNYIVLIENPKVRNTALIGLDIFDIIFLGALMLFTEANYFYCILFLCVRNFVSFAIAVENLKVNIFSLRPTLKSTWKYVRYGFVPMLTMLMMEINYKVDIVMLERMDISKAEIGVYSLGVMLAQKLWMIPDALRDILTGKLAKGKTEQEVCKISRYSLWVTIACIAGMAIFGKLIIRLLFGEEYSGAYKVFINISLGVIGMVFYKMIYAYNIVNGHKNINFILLFIAALSNVILNYFLIQSMSINGAAIASMISYLVCGISFLVYFVITTKTNPKELLFIKKDDIKSLIHYIKK